MDQLQPLQGGYAFEKVADYFEDLQFSLKDSAGNKTTQSSNTKFIEIYAIIKITE